MSKYGLNQVTLIGNLGKDPELKYLDQGIAYTNLSLACTENYRDKNGQNVDQTVWVSVVLWRSQAEIAAKYCRKGSTVCVHGRLITRSWETPQGEKRSKTEVEGRRLILLDNKPVHNPLATPVGTETITQSQAVAQNATSENLNEDIDDLDELPF